MYRSILLPLDGSNFAEEALPMAAHLARGEDAALHLLHVVRPALDMNFKTPQEDLEWRTTVREAASVALGERVASLRRTGISAHAEVLEGRVSDAILATARERQADLVVLTTHGDGGFRRWWLGSTADELLRRGEVPLLLVRPWDDTAEREAEAPRFETILVPLDGSTAAEAVLPHVRWLRDARGAKLILVRVTPSPLEVGSLYGIPTVRLEGESHRWHKEEALRYLETVAERMGGDGYDGPPPELRVVEASSAAEGVLEAARVHGADLLAIATHGRGGLGRSVLGSVADKVIRGSAIPVLAIRPRD